MKEGRVGIPGDSLLQLLSFSPGPPSRVAHQTKPHRVLTTTVVLTESKSGVFILPVRDPDMNLPCTLERSIFYSIQEI